MTSLYRCTFCSLPPLRWREGKSYCCTHAVEIGVPDTDAAYGIVKPRRVNTSTFTPSAKMNGRENFKAYLAYFEEKYSAAEDDGVTPYVPDRYSESTVEHTEITGLNLPYRGLNDEPQELPF